MRVISDSMGRVVVGPDRPGDQFYGASGVAVHIMVDNVRRGARFIFRCNNSKHEFFNKRLSAEKVVMYLPNMTDGSEYELVIDGDNYGQVNKVFHPPGISMITKIKLTERNIPPHKKPGVIQRIKNTLGW